MYPTRQHFTFQTPLIKHEFARQSICFRYPLIFNNMSLIIREKIYTHSPEGYKNYIKKTNDPIIFRWMFNTLLLYMWKKFLIYTIIQTSSFLFISINGCKWYQYIQRKSLIKKFVIIFLNFLLPISI